MPHLRCSVCRHPERQAIDAALKAGESLRKLAKRFGVSYQTVHRHLHEEDRDKTRIKTGQIARIDEEIKKLIRAQNRAKKKRDSAGALAIARELRNWFVLRQKAEVVACAASQVETNTTMTRGEALAVAQGLIESEVSAGSQEIIVWLRGLLERADAGKRTEEVPRATGNVPEAQE
jgi:transposase-like protein